VPAILTWSKSTSDLTSTIGTWLDADSGLKNGQRQPPSNVSRFGWAIKDTSSDGIAQIVHYQAGVGTSGGILSRAIGGATGEGLEENVRETYSFLAINYREGDEIFLVGFSRGAWTARSVAGMIGALGLLTREGLPMFPEIYLDFERRADPNYVPRWPDVPFPDKPPFDPAYVTELQRRRLTRTNIPIKAVGVWDTVGKVFEKPTMSKADKSSRKFGYSSPTTQPFGEDGDGNWASFQRVQLLRHIIASVY
jgi:Uncharacterized alpha/beta hydrolase domain (DUF2235)